MGDWQFIGKHSWRFEPPDVFFSRSRGDVAGPEMLGLIQAFHASTEQVGHSIFWVANVKEMGAFTSAAREATARLSKNPELRNRLRGSAVFGASFATRAVVSLMVRAVRVLNPDKLRPLAFVETEAEARAFLAMQRDAAGGHSRA